jgi:hypothetical protein
VDQNRTTAAVEGLLARAYSELALGQDDRYAGFKALAGKIYERYQAKTANFDGGQQRVGLPPFADINRTVLNQLLDPMQGMPIAARAVLRTQLQLPPETISTNALPAESTSTNLPEVMDTNTANSVTK